MIKSRCQSWHLRKRRSRAEKMKPRDSPEFCVVASAILQALMAFIPVSVSGHVSAATAVARTLEAASAHSAASH